MIDFNEIVSSINTILAAYSLWDGYWVHDYRRRSLIISTAFDRILHRDFDLIFNKVIFFNVPSEWRESNMQGNELLRVASAEEFGSEHPGFDTGDHIIFAIDLYFPDAYSPEAGAKDTFYIVAKHVFLVECIAAGDDSPWPAYTDRYEDDEHPYPCKLNRVVR